MNSINEKLLHNIIAENIKQLRSTNGKTQDELASAVGMSRAAIANYESGNFPVEKISTIYKICVFFEVEISEILPSVITLSMKSSPTEQLKKSTDLGTDTKKEIGDFLDEI